MQHYKMGYFSVSFYSCPIILVSCSQFLNTAIRAMHSSMPNSITSQWCVPVSQSQNPRFDSCWNFSTSLVSLGGIRFWLRIQTDIPFFNKNVNESDGLKNSLSISVFDSLFSPSRTCGFSYP